jgi:hypothetical protein
VQRDAGEELVHAQRHPLQLSLRDLGHGLSFGSALSFTGFAIVYASPIVRAGLEFFALRSGKSVEDYCATPFCPPWKSSGDAALFIPRHRQQFFVASSRPCPGVFGVRPFWEGSAQISSSARCCIVSERSTILAARMFREV